jgi:hypothetical protein
MTYNQMEIEEARRRLSRSTLVGPLLPVTKEELKELFEIGFEFHQDYIIPGVNSMFNSQLELTPFCSKCDACIGQYWLNRTVILCEQCANATLTDWEFACGSKPPQHPYEIEQEKADLEEALAKCPSHFHEEIRAKAGRKCEVCSRPISSFAFRMDMCDSCSRDENNMEVSAMIEALYDPFADDDSRLDFDDYVEMPNCSFLNCIGCGSKLPQVQSKCGVRYCNTCTTLQDIQYENGVEVRSNITCNLCGVEIHYCLDQKCDGCKLVERAK